MGWESERKAIESRFATNWTTTPIKYEGAPFAEQHVPHVALFIRYGDRSQVSLGNNPTIRSVSVIIVQIFVLRETGTALAKTYADSIAAIFDRVQFMTADNNLISCQTASIEQADETEGFFQMNVSIPYTRDEN
jgi:hypothetical protein